MATTRSARSSSRCLASCVATYVDLRNLLVVESPHGDVEIEIGQDTVADFDALERERDDSGRPRSTAVAVRDG